MKASAETKSSILSTLDQVWKCWSDKRWDDLIENYVPDSDLRVIGTGAGEIYLGPESLKTNWKESEGQLGKMKFLEYEDPVFSESGNVAWFSAGLKIEFPAQGGPLNIYLRCSAVFERRDDRWLIAQMHISAPLISGCLLNEKLGT